MLQNLNYLYPELILAGGALLALLGGVYSRADNAVFFTSRFSCLVLLAALGSTLTLPQGVDKIIFGGMYHFDSFGMLIKSLLLFSAAIVMLISFQYLDDKTNNLSFEYPILILLSVLGMIIFISSNDFLILYLGLELQSLSLYILAAIKRNERRASEAGIKYFVLGALASGIILYGVSIIYGYTGATNFDHIATALKGQYELSKAVIVGLVLVITGLSFKLSAAPFHMWAPDVYEGVPTPVLTFFATVPKLAAISIFIRLLNLTVFSHFAAQWEQVVIAISLISMLVGSFGAIWQSNIKRLLAYSSIGHVGYAMLGLIANSALGAESVIVYFIIYILTSFGIFIILLSLKSSGILIEKISDFKGLASQHPVIALLMSLLMFSMIGLPFPPYPGLLRQVLCL